MFTLLSTLSFFWGRRRYNSYFVLEFYTMHGWYNTIPMGLWCIRNGSWFIWRNDYLIYIYIYIDVYIYIFIHIYIYIYGYIRHIVALVHIGVYIYVYKYGYEFVRALQTKFQGSFKPKFQAPISNVKPQFQGQCKYAVSSRSCGKRPISRVSFKGQFQGSVSRRAGKLDATSPFLKITPIYMYMHIYMWLRAFIAL